MRFFNTAGPVRADLHYCLPPVDRLDLDEVVQLIDQQKYFVLHAPRQTGKTSCLMGLMEHLNATGQYRALYANIEAAQAGREDVERAIPTVVHTIAMEAGAWLDDSDAMALWDECRERSAAGTMLRQFLTTWCDGTPMPTVLLLDEVDALVGDTLISLLRQLRAGYNTRPAQFPQSIILCGVRDVRDYRIHSDQEKAIITGGSAFNIKAESLRLGNFGRSEVEALYAQHTEATGQRFDPEAVDAVWDLTRGQPWLVNALGYEACWKMKQNQDRSRVVTAEQVLLAKENLILGRVTHLDQLADKLKEERVRAVIAPMLEGSSLSVQASEDDIEYAVDLGLVTRGDDGLQIANPIYREVIPRELTWVTQINFESTVQRSPFVMDDGRLDVPKLLAEFQQFFRENAEHWMERFEYKEAGPHLLLQAFLQRIVNAGGRVEREYGLGRRRTDLLVLWRVGDTGETQRAVIELKLVRGSLAQTIAEGLPQTADYMDRCAADQGHLVLFDRDEGKSWDERVFRRDESHGGRTITVWGM